MRRDLPNGVYVFYFHDVSDDTDVPNSIRTSPQRFAYELDYISSNFEVVDLPGALIKLNGEWQDNVDGRYAAVCFDDGFYSVLTTAYPYLKRHHMPATLFLNGAFVAQETWAEVLLFHQLETQHSRPALNEMFPKLAQYRSTALYARHQSGSAFLKRLQGLVEKDYNRKKVYMDENDVRKFSPRLISVANHTYSHFMLSNLEARDQEVEIDRGHRFLEGLDNYVSLLGIPFGDDSSFDSDTLEILKKSWGGLVIKASGGTDHRRRGGLLYVERMGLNNNKPPIPDLVRDRVLGKSLGRRLADRARSAIRQVGRPAPR